MKWILKGDQKPITTRSNHTLVGQRTDFLWDNITLSGGGTHSPSFHESTFNGTGQSQIIDDAEV